MHPDQTTLAEHAAVLPDLAAVVEVRLVGQSPALRALTQQAAEHVAVALQVYVLCANSHHLEKLPRFSGMTVKLLLP